MLIGAHTHATWAYGDDKGAGGAKDIDDLASIGGGIVRVDVGWATLQLMSSRSDQLDTGLLQKLDVLIERAWLRKVKVTLVLHRTPCWASSAPPEIRKTCASGWWNDDRIASYLPTEPVTYVMAAMLLARRYGEKLYAVEAWNEPNQSILGPNQVEDYARLVGALWSAFQALPAEKRPKVVAGAVAEVDFDYIRRLLPLIADVMDAFSVHPYSHNVGPLELRGSDLAGQSFVGAMPWVADQVRRVAPHAEVWITEAGWSTNSLREPQVSSHDAGVAEDTAARFTRDLIRLCLRWGSINVLVLYALRKVGPVNPKDPAQVRAAAADLIGNYGLFRTNGKPSLAALEVKKATAPDYRP